MIFFSIGSCIVLTSLRKGADSLSPARVFGLVWSFALGLTTLKLSALQHDWSPESWVLVLVGPVSFLLGTFASYIQNLEKKLSPLSHSTRLWKGSELNEKKLFALTMLAFIFYGVGYVIIYEVKGFIPAFAFRPGAARTEFTMFGLGMALQTMPVIVVCTVIYTLLETSSRRRRWILILSSGLSLVTFFLLLQRFQIMLAAILCVVLLYYTTRRINLRAAALFSVLSGLLFYWVATLRTGKIYMYLLHADSRMKFSPRYAVLTEPYMYVVMNLENLARATVRNEHFSYGFYTFDFVMALSGLKHWVTSYFGMIDNPYLVAGYNTYSAFWVYYRDFGPVGIVGIPLLMGWIISWLYYRMRHQPHVFSLFGYSMGVFVMIISFFNSPLSLLWFVYVIVAVALILRFSCSAKSPQSAVNTV